MIITRNLIQSVVQFRNVLLKASTQYFALRKVSTLEYAQTRNSGNTRLLDFLGCPSSLARPHLCGAKEACDGWFHMLSVERLILACA